MTTLRTLVISGELQQAAKQLAASGAGKLQDVYSDLYSSGRALYDGRSLPLIASSGTGSLSRKVDPDIYEDCLAIAAVHDRSASYVFRQLCLLGLEDKRAAGTAGPSKEGSAASKA